MTELQMLESFLNGPVFAYSVGHLDFYDTDGNDYSFVVYNHQSGDWMVNLPDGVSAKAPTLALAIDKAQKEWEEYWNVD